MARSKKKRKLKRNSKKNPSPKNRMKVREEESYQKRKNPMEALKHLKQAFQRSSEEDKKARRRPTWGELDLRKAWVPFFLPWPPLSARARILATLTGKPLLNLTWIARIKALIQLEVTDPNTWHNPNQAMPCYFEIATGWLTFDTKIYINHLKPIAIKSCGATRVAKQDWPNYQPSKELLHSLFERCTNNFLFPIIVMIK